MSVFPALIIVAAGGSASPSPSPDTPASGGFDPAWIALLGVVLAQAVAIFLQKRAADNAAKRDVANALLAHRTRQLDELYGPILPRLEQSRRLYVKLQKPKGWRMLDHADEVLGDPETKLIAMRILELGEEIEGIVLTHASLARHPGPPATFNLYVGHVAVLRLMLREGLRRPPLPEEYFPQQFNQDVQQGYTAILDELERMRASQREG
jgi:hypothetical protein